MLTVSFSLGPKDIVFFEHARTRGFVIGEALAMRSSSKKVHPSPASTTGLVNSFTSRPTTIEPVQDGRIYIELVNAPFLKAGGSPAEYRAGIDRALARGWLML